MKISIIGHTGFIGKYLKGEFDKKYLIKVFSLRNEKIDNIPIKTLDEIFSSDYIINCAASLNPKSKNDLYLNENFPADLTRHNINYKKKIIHLSTINVLINDRLDIYTKSKKNCENFIKDNNNIFILRLPLVINKKNNIYEKIGNIAKIYKYLKFINLPIYPFIYPGHIYEPIDVHYLKKKIDDIILNKVHDKVINLTGNKKISLWDLAHEIAEQENKKLFKVRAHFFFKFLPSFLKKFIKKQNNFLQQIASIDHTKY